VVFTTINNNIYNTEEILNWYRVRWQIELTFKRFKSLANLGCLPKYNEQSSKAWLYSKLLIALLTEKIIKYSNFSPWGYVI
jgi:IS4 transposase